MPACCSALRRSALRHDRRFSTRGRRIRHRPARPGPAELDRRPSLATRCRVMAVHAHRRAAARATGADRKATRRHSDQGLDRRRRRGLCNGPPGPRHPGHGLHLLDRRPGQLPRDVRGTCPARKDGIANTLHKLGAQRGRGLLAHCDAVSAAVNQPVRVGCELRRGAARGQHPVPGHKRAGTARGLRPALPRTAECGAHGVGRVCSRHCAGAAAARLYRATDPRGRAASATERLQRCGPE